jgi:hypothetical protein
MGRGFCVCRTSALSTLESAYDVGQGFKLKSELFLTTCRGDNDLAHGPFVKIFGTLRLTNTHSLAREKSNYIRLRGGGRRFNNSTKVVTFLFGHHFTNLSLLANYIFSRHGHQVPRKLTGKSVANNAGMQFI